MCCKIKKDGTEYLLNAENAEDLIAWASVLITNMKILVRFGSRVVLLRISIGCRYSCDVAKLCLCARVAVVRNPCRPLNCQVKMKRRCHLKSKVSSGQSVILTLCLFFFYYVSHSFMPS